ncbi:hypothetical protein [Histophilus somni]|uniref:hypothetical protein n=1 Tax=Histophilus somni TaxID=731 RepID=UPI000B2A9788|nr:hypothetical protein [Histophilus somni]
MKQILFKYFMLITCVLGLSGCGYLLSLGQLMLDGRCADWNCSKPTPRWRKAVDDCYSRNFGVVKQQLGYKDHGEVQDSDIGQHISYQCVRHDGRYDIRKDKQYGHLFVK